MNKLKHWKNALPRYMITSSLVVALTAGPVSGIGIAMAESPTLQNDLLVEADAVIHQLARYRVDARLDEKKMMITGKETVTYRNNTKDTLDNVVFHTFADANRSKDTQSSMFQSSNKRIAAENPDKKPEDFLGGIDIKTVKSSSKLLKFDNTHQALTVRLGQALQPGQSITLELDFEVKIPYGSQRLSYYRNIINGAHWFPVLSVYDPTEHTWNKTPYSSTFESDYYDSADYQVTLNVPADYQVSMPGALTVQEAEVGRKTVTATANNTREFVLFASPDFKVESVTRDGLTVQYYYFENQKDKKQIIDQYIDQAFKVIDFFSEKYGKYPYPEFRIVESYVEGVAVEFSRMIQMGMIQGQPDIANNSAFVHEIAHQWFHSLIGNDSETESFLDEGFADYSMVYFYEKQEVPLNGFKLIQFDEVSLDSPIVSTNDTVGDSPDAIFYKKGRQAIYELYRTLGEEKFDELMQTYFDQYVYKNATIDGLLQIIENKAGKKVRDNWEADLRNPNYSLRPEYRLTADEEAAYMHEQFKSIYHSVFVQFPEVPVETMSRIIDKTLQGEALTIIMSDGQISDHTKKQQDQLLNQIQGFMQLAGLKPTVITERHVLKNKLRQDLGDSNVIVIGKPDTNGFIQALKSGIIKRADTVDFKWRDIMNKNNQSGAYIIKHPYNQNRLMLHYFWTGDQLSEQASDLFMDKASESLSFSNHFYQYYVMNNVGKISNEHKVENPYAKLFAD
ncbi:M1 family peptidase [Paenibacillus anaericanus]|uniref:M1 family peptidase n=1 Tax=Paenibacillus anaericanus TaxID=170367 RepID=A0A433Y7W1_9BACL|nr:M1 family metallopeptidase [Paenibacillus anaericanus]RUT45484.1 M1 family peptidase [Paenibacillus anaericanus]